MSERPDRLVTPKLREEDLADASLRPKRLADYVGQDKVKEKLKILIEAAKGRGEGLDHLLLYGPPGLGKTTLANIIANEMEVKIRVSSGPAILIPGDAASILTTLQQGDVFFIDEIHRLSRPVEETLYPAMEDYAIDIMLGKGLQAKSVRLRLPQFTIIGATTRYALLSSPLRDRFTATERLDFYDVDSMEQIVLRSAKILNVKLELPGAAEIAKRARGTPRIGNRLLKRVRDFAQVRAQGVITLAVAEDALGMLEVDNLGLDEVDRAILKAIISKFGGGPVGVDTIAAAISEEADTIMDVYEPFLLQLGFIARSPRGRVATDLAYRHLGISRADNSPRQESLL